MNSSRTEEEDDDELSCAVCLEEMDADTCIELRECAHAFHRSCVHDWFQTNASCPMCRLRPVEVRQERFYRLITELTARVRKSEREQRDRLAEAHAMYRYAWCLVGLAPLPVSLVFLLWILMPPIVVEYLGMFLAISLGCGALELIVLFSIGMLCCDARTYLYVVQQVDNHFGEDGVADEWMREAQVALHMAVQETEDVRQRRGSARRARSRHIV